MKSISCLSATMAGLAIVSSSFAGSVDFESISGGASAEGMVVVGQYDDATFSRTDGAPLVLVDATNATLVAFGGPVADTGPDAVADASRDGSFFLSDSVAGFPAGDLIITFENLAIEASVDLLDIDGSEGWTVSALDVNNNVLDSASISAGDAGTGDGVATLFSFDRADFDIASLRVAYTGSLAQGGGWGLDNVASIQASVGNPIPLPPAAFSALGMIAVMGAAKLVRRVR